VYDVVLKAARKGQAAKKAANASIGASNWGLAGNVLYLVPD